MTVSLIISTYNWPRALYLCLDSVMQQTVMPSEIIIADDGSGIATRDVVRHFEAVSPVPVRHIWHEDDGFRLAEIRNKAIGAQNFRIAVNMEPQNLEYRNALSSVGSGAYTYRQTQYSDGSDELCGLCSSLMCLNCLCGGCR